jgi:hypothetical protein
MLKKLINIFKRNKVQRKLSLIHVHTFATGEKLYTYKEEDWGNISSRYYRGMQEYAKYIHSFNLTKNEWESAVDNCLNICVNAVQKKNNVEDIMQVHNSLLWFKDKMNGIKTANEAELEFIFCMFFVLEDEVETGYSPIHNEKKIELLNQNLELRDFFLQKVKQIAKDLLTRSREDTLKSLILMEQTNEQIMTYKRTMQN